MDQDAAVMPAIQPRFQRRLACKATALTIIACAVTLVVVFAGGESTLFRLFADEGVVVGASVTG
jgi:hypothetical protein